MSTTLPHSKAILRFTLFLVLTQISCVVSHGDLHQERTHDGAVSPNEDHDAHTFFEQSAILGSKKEAEQFEDLSPEEAKKRLRGIAKRMDANQDGFVDRNELKEWILKSFASLSLEEAAERFEDADRNEDKLVSWDEHYWDSFGDGFLKADTAEEKKENQEVLKEERELFDLADKDKNGLLNSEEYARLSQPLDFPEMHKLIVTHALRKKDENKDGKISMDEFTKDTQLSKEQVLEERERFQYELDKNKDSALDFDEFSEWVIPDHEKTADQEAEHLQVTADDDKDGKLSVDEIVKHFKLFTSSEATDFGEYLVKYKDEL